jgi:hypothetical protein
MAKFVAKFLKPMFSQAPRPTFSKAAAILRGKKMVTPGKSRATI